MRVKRTGKPRTTQRAAAIERATTAREYVDRGGRKQDLLYDLKNDYFRVVREEDVPDGLAWLPPGVVFDREVRDAGGRWNSSKGGPYHATVVWCRWLPDFELRDAAGGVSRGAWQVQWKHRGSRTVSHVPKEDVRVRAAAPAPAAVPNHALLVGATAPTPAPAPVPPRPRAPPPAAAVVDLTQDDAAPPAPRRRARGVLARRPWGPAARASRGRSPSSTAPTGPRRAPAPAPAPAAAPPPLPPFDPLATAPAPAAPAADDDDWRRRMANGEDRAARSTQDPRGYSRWRARGSRPMRSAGGVHPRCGVAGTVRNAESRSTDRRNGHPPTIVVQQGDDLAAR